MNFFSFLFLLLSFTSVYCANRRVVIDEKRGYYSCDEDEEWVTMGLQLPDGFFDGFLFPVISCCEEPSEFWVEKEKNKYIACDMIHTSQGIRIKKEVSDLTKEDLLFRRGEEKIKEALCTLLSLDSFPMDEENSGVYCQGSIWWANLRDITDESNDKQRPVLIISNSSYNEHSDEVIIIKITTKRSNGVYAFYKIPIDLEEKSYIDYLSIYRIPKTKLRAFRKTHNQAPEDVLKAVKKKLLKLFS